MPPSLDSLDIRQALGITQETHTGPGYNDDEDDESVPEELELLGLP